MGRNLLQKLLERASKVLAIDVSEEDRKIIEMVRPFTMTSMESLIALIGAVRYIIRSGISGDIAECGIWRGGSMMAVALVLKAEKDMSRNLYLYDTFEGMSEPTMIDKSYDGTLAKMQLDRKTKQKGKVWCYCGLDEVKVNLNFTGYPPDQMHFVKGKVEATIPQTAPTTLALLRLDTDWYESTKHELKYLFPLLNERGVLIVDDYGHWQGAKLAVDEYFSSQPRQYYLHRIDYTGRLLVKS
jgi:O-methyltransferase